MIKLPVFIRVFYISIKNPEVEYFPLTGKYDAVPKEVSIYVSFYYWIV